MRVDRLRVNYQIAVEFTHFPLHPDTPVEGLTLEQLFAGRDFNLPAIKVRMALLMADESLPYDVLESLVVAAGAKARNGDLLAAGMPWLPQESQGS